eukprot:COSAG01_NODE_27401_length_686_cov_17.127768_1_plen_102_part_10
MRVQKVERASLTRREMPSRGPCGDTLPGTRYISHVYTLCNAWRKEFQDGFHAIENDALDILDNFLVEIRWKDHDIDQSVIDDCLKPENMQSWLKLPAPATPA